MTESVGEMLSFLQMRVIKELKKQYPDVISEDERLLTIALEDVYSETGEAFVFIIDEWDCMLRDKSYHADDQKRYLDFISGTVGTCKRFGKQFQKFDRESL